MNFQALKIIYSNLQKAPQPVKLVAVTKAFDLPTTRALIKEGIKAIAENRLKAAEEKFPSLPPIEKHFIGQIQSKKLKKIIQSFDIIESVASNRHLIKIDQIAEELNKPLQVFLQFNISGDIQKAGYLPKQCEEIKNTLSLIQFIQVTGVMGMATPSSDSFLIHSQFQNLRKLRDQLKKDFPSVTELSMGMSTDYKIAIQEGATIVRLGSALFESIILN